MQITLQEHLIEVCSWRQPEFNHSGIVYRCQTAMGFSSGEPFPGPDLSLLESRLGETRSGGDSQLKLGRVRVNQLEASKE